VRRAAGAEDGGADPDVRGAKADRLFEIGAHAHAEDPKIIVPGNLPQQGEMRGRLLIERRHAHQTDDRQTEPLPAIDDELIGIGGHDARLLGFFPGIYLDEARRPTAAALHFPHERLRETQPVDAFDHVEELDGVAHFVGLKGADQVQREVRKFLAQLRIFRFGLLHPILAEDAMSGRQSLTHARGRVGFADGDQCHALGRAVRRPRRRRDALPDGGEIGRDNPFHSCSIPGKDRAMSVPHYRASAAFAASLSLALTACVASPPAEQASGQPVKAETQKSASSEPDEIDTEATIFTVLGLAKKGSVKEPGPQTGRTVSPILWQAAHDTLDFVKYASEDPLTGSIVTDWYSPQENPNVRYRVNVFILSRALHSDSLTVTVDRQQRGPDGQWTETTIARQVETDLENAILSRARQLKRAWAAEAS
jgi:hypothetical protein